MSGLQLLGAESQKQRPDLLQSVGVRLAQREGCLGNFNIQYIQGAVTSIFLRQPRFPEPIPRYRGLRSRELEWRHANGEALRQYAGEWVALENNEIVAHGPDPARVVNAAREHGIRVPYVFKVEDEADGVVRFGL